MKKFLNSFTNPFSVMKELYKKLPLVKSNDQKLAELLATNKDKILFYKTIDSLNEGESTEIILNGKQAKIWN